jgi:Tol biopolymer transport system component
MRVVVTALVFACRSAAAQSPEPLNHGGLPYASPDGKWIAFHSNRDGTPDVYVIGADGNGLQRLTSSPNREGIAGWTPDSREVLFTSTPPGPFSMTAVPTTVMAASLDGKSRTVSTIIGRGAAVSPDGKRVAFSGGRVQVSVMMVANIDGSNARVLSDSTKVAAFNFAWEPNGKRVAYTQMTVGGPGRPKLSLWTVNPDGGEPKLLSEIDSTEGSAQWPAWSPDGKRVAVQVGKYDRNDPKKNTSHIFVIDVASGRATKLNPHDTPYLDETPSWLGNGHLAIQSDRSGRMEIWVMSAEGKDARQLTR